MKKKLFVKLSPASIRRYTGCSKGHWSGTLIGALSLLFASAVLGQEAYLDALEAEAGKVRSPSDPSQVPSLPSAPAVAGATRERFEALLLEKYRGTYVFYQKLLPHIQAELFNEFQSGVPIAELREKIVDRYLQR